MNRVVLCFGALLVFSAGPAGASLIGDTVGISASTGFSDSAVVVAGTTEFDLGSVLIDFESESILFGYGPGAVSQGSIIWTFSDLDWLDESGNAIAGQIVNVIVTTTALGADFINSVSWTDHSVTMNLAGGALDGPNSTILLDLVVEHGVVPEPATMTLLGIGLAGFALRRRMMKA